MSFFDKHFRNKNKAGAIGIIGGASGPATIFIAKAEEQEEFLTYAAGQITPCDRTFIQLEEYLIEKYHAIPHTLLTHELKTLKANVILNYFREVIDMPEPLGDNPTRQELIAYAKKDTYFEQAREYPAEKLGLEMKAYKLLGIPSSVKHYVKDGQGIESYTNAEVIAEMEMKSEYLSICNGGKEVSDDLVLYRGVSEKDIQARTPRFMNYAYTLRHMGKL